MIAAGVSEYGPAGDLGILEVETPEPGPGEISIDVEYAGTGFVDTLLRSGTFPLWLPMVPGIEVVGRVRALGEGVDWPAVGRRVGALLNDFGRGPRAGGYAEVALAHRTMVVPLPEKVDGVAVAAVLSNGVAAWIALHEIARLSPQDRVLVLGASGGLGATSVRIAALHPAREVIAVVSRDRDRAPVEATAVILSEELGERLDGLVDVVVDPVGEPLRATAFDHLAPFGRHLVVGNADGGATSFSGETTWLETRLVAGLSVGGIAHLRPAMVSAALEAVVALIARGALREPPPTVEPLERAGAVHAALEARTAPAKTVLVLGAGN